MKFIGFIVNLFLVFSVLGTAQDVKKKEASPVKQSAKMEKWKTFGANVTMKEPTSLKKILDNKKQFAGKDVLIEGTISEVCQNKGCWMVVVEGDKHVRVEFKDYAFFVPWESEQKTVRMQGKLIDKTIGKGEAKHMAGEMKDSPVKSEEIKDEQDITVFVATGVSIKGAGDISKEQQEVLDGKRKVEGHADETEE